MILFFQILFQGDTKYYTQQAYNGDGKLYILEPSEHINIETFTNKGGCFVSYCTCKCLTENNKEINGSFCMSGSVVDISNPSESDKCFFTLKYTGKIRNNIVLMIAQTTVSVLLFLAICAELIYLKAAYYSKRKLA